MASPTRSRNRRPLPAKMLIGYGTNCDRVRKAVHDGVNIVIWAFMDIVAVDNEHEDSDHRELLESQTDTDTPRRGRIKTDLDLNGIRQLIQELDQNGYNHVIHLVSFGGWNGPHLDAALSAEEWYDCWKESEAGSLFHGMDWDLEGHDDLTRPTNVFTIECLEKMGHISRMMKEDGYLVGMAPPQSYMNFDNPHLSRYVNLTEPDRPWHSEFHYFGANVYSYVLAKYGDFIDFVSMQLYESYSLAAMAVYHENIEPEDYLISYIQDLVVKQKEKFYVDFSQDKDLNMEGQYTHLPLKKLVIGLANGWAADPENRKHIFIAPEQIQKAYNALQNSDHGDLSPRGFMFWTIEEEGTRDVYLARDIHKTLNP
ncbi:expressed unknown protein [Seminavis robusta]|uniref:Uncharacterized protein n=1 Tax=Seminavis robusta TaxID=568900 RepID=A0A9N8H3Z7_9STRA|nr:expressed unknown protein [Seminavis robusta]|eukprot:Sro49_g028760.1 n/a (369) ;mRNA; r:113979-115085